MKENKINTKKSIFAFCDLCGKNKSVYVRKHSGQNLCSQCYIKSVETIINKTISKYNMLSPDDKIIVALSGGKDSIALLYNLIKIQKNTFNSKPLVAISINEGIDKYSSERIDTAQNFCKKYKISHKIYSFKEEIGKTLYEIIEIKKEDFDFRFPCNYCAIIRRRLLNDIAKDLGGTILALGHNLTDFSETFLMNILYKRFNLIAQKSLSEGNKSINEFYLRKINPLMKLPENEVALYANLNNFEYYKIKCPYRKEYPILRKKVLDFITNLKIHSPEIEFNLFNGFLELSEILNNEYNNSISNNCLICGYPTNNKICNYCKLIDDIG
ncbi:MAG: TIGR00269 family protein [Promethearchaeota archaeon]|nr:MAG: TIGR00269 family protein [Candidatus Lokiarchaeota archaeon]